jgi:hypothetical protein
MLWAVIATASFLLATSAVRARTSPALALLPSMKISCFVKGFNPHPNEDPPHA